MIFILEGKDMKRVMIVAALTLFTLQLYAQESYWQVSRRARYYGDEWNNSNELRNELRSESLIKFYTYMYGYALAAQYICEGLRNVGMSEFAYLAEFFQKQIESYEAYFERNKLWLEIYYGSYKRYYEAGQNRIIKQSRRYTASDFR
jgi:hypothetical protein